MDAAELPIVGKMRVTAHHAVKTFGAGVRDQSVLDHFEDAAPFLGFFLQPFGQLLVNFLGNVIARAGHLAQKNTIEHRIELIAVQNQVQAARKRDLEVLDHRQTEERRQDIVGSEAAVGAGFLLIMISADQDNFARIGQLAKLVHYAPMSACELAQVQAMKGVAVQDQAIESLPS